jgi:hypothetical protein
MIDATLKIRLLNRCSVVDGQLDDLAAAIALALGDDPTPAETGLLTALERDIARIAQRLDDRTEALRQLWSSPQQ